MSDEEIRAATVGEVPAHDAPIELVDSDPAWPELFRREAERIRAALGQRVLVLEHCGSTSVPGLAAKPIIDVVMSVADSSDEPAYVPPLEAAGYVLRIREPGWHQHRLFKGPGTNVNVHVFSAGCPEIERMLRFRDHLRTDGADRELYERTKRELAARSWHHVQHYADAKTAVVEEIMARAGSDPSMSYADGVSARDTEKANKDALARFYRRVFDRQDLAFVDHGMAPDFVEHEDLGGGLAHTRDGFKDWLAGFASSFPDLAVTVESMSAEGDRVWARITLRGTHRGPFLGVPPTGRRFAVTAIDEFRFAHGRIAEHWGVSDSMELLRQLGLTPPPAGGASVGP